MPYPMLYTRTVTGAVLPVTEVLDLAYGTAGKETDTLFIQHTYDAKLSAVRGMTLLNPQFREKTCSVCKYKSALMMVGDENGRIEAFCIDCSVGQLMKPI